MSHADGLAILPNGDEYWFEYDGTMDICCTRLYKEYEELHANWRKDNRRDCSCSEKERVSIPVVLSTSYGAFNRHSGWQFLWLSEICKKCMCIIGKVHEIEY